MVRYTSYKLRNVKGTRDKALKDCLIILTTNKGIKFAKQVGGYTAGVKLAIK